MGSVHVPRARWAGSWGGSRGWQRVLQACPWGTPVRMPPLDPKSCCAPCFPPDPLDINPSVDFLFDCGLVGPDDVSTDQDLPRAVRKVSDCLGRSCQQLSGRCLLGPSLQLLGTGAMPQREWDQAWSFLLSPLLHPPALEPASFTGALLVCSSGTQHQRVGHPYLHLMVPAQPWHWTGPAGLVGRLYSQLQA